VRYVPVNSPRPGQTIRCNACGRFKPAAETFANLDGPAFRDYLCAQCYAGTMPPCATCGFILWPGQPHNHNP
jgi:hypothetical protein